MNRMSSRSRSGRSVGRRGAVALVVTVALAACGNADTDEAAANLNDPTQGPLAKLLGYDISPADQRAKELEVQQVVVECMKSEGWEYQAVDYSAAGGTDWAAGVRRADERPPGVRREVRLRRRPWLRTAG